MVDQAREVFRRIDRSRRESHCHCAGPGLVWFGPESRAASFGGQMDTIGQETSHDRPADGAVAAEAVSPSADPGTIHRRSNVGYYDPEGRFLYATPALAAYVGMTPDELIGRTWYEIGVPPEAVHKLEATRRRVLETGEPLLWPPAFGRRGSGPASGLSREPPAFALRATEGTFRTTKGGGAGRNRTDA